MESARERTRVILADDHAMVLDTMAAAVDASDELELVGQASSVAEAARLLGVRDADVLVADLDLGDGKGTDLIEHAAPRSVSTLLITGHDDAAGVDAALHAGCAGFVSKSQGFGELVNAILAIARGAAVFPADLLQRSLEDDVSPNADDLTPRELEVLQQMAEARSVQEIADELYLSPHTVRNHVKQILMKLDVHSQLAAVVTAARRGYVDIS